MSSNQDRAPKGRKIILNKPINWPLWGLSEQVRAVRFVADEEGLIWGIPTVLSGTEFAGNQAVGDETNIAAVGSAPDHLSLSTHSLSVRSSTYVKHEVRDQLEILKTPTVWKTVTCTAGANTIWDPAAGTRFRLMGGLITVSKDAATAAQEYITLLDGAAVFMTFTISGAALVATGNVIVIPFSFPLNGYLSTTADNILGLTLATDFTAGNCNINVWGIEE